MKGTQRGSSARAMHEPVWCIMVIVWNMILLSRVPAGAVSKPARAYCIDAGERIQVAAVQRTALLRPWGAAGVHEMRSSRDRRQDNARRRWYVRCAELAPWARSGGRRRARAPVARGERT